MRQTIAEELHELRRLTGSGEARKIREAAGLSQADIARSVDADPSTIARWENGTRVPRGAAAIAYGRLLLRLGKATTA